MYGLNWNNWFGSEQPVRQPDLDGNAVDWLGEQPDSEPQAGDGQAGIAIPGYKSIALKADQAQQNVNLYNPGGQRLLLCNESAPAGWDGDLEVQDDRSGQGTV